MRSQTIYTELPHLKEVISNVNLLFMTVVSKINTATAVFITLILFDSFFYLNILLKTKLHSERRRSNITR